jgi:hypothetical protein
VKATRDQPHERLKAWHACNELAKAVFRVSAGWPMEHQEVLGDEVRTSARQAAQSLETGAMLGAAAEFYEQTVEACGKLGRLWSTLVLARDESLIGKKDYGELETLRDHATRLTWGLRTHLRRKIERELKPGEGKKAGKRKV